MYEIRPEPSTLGGAVGIFSNGLRLCERLGVYDQLLSRGSSVSTLTIRNLHGDILGAQDVVGLAKEKIGFGYLRIKRMDLLDVLLQAAATANIPVKYNKRITGITETEHAVNVTFSDGTTDSADLLLGCDGIHSAVRGIYVDPDQTPKYSGFAGLGSLVPMTALKPPATSLLGEFNGTFTTEGTFMVMPCTKSGDEMYWGFSKELPLPESGDTRDGWQVHRKEEVDTFKESLLPLLKDSDGEWSESIRQIVNSTSAVFFYPSFKLPSGGRWHKGRCVLLGDAAHAMPPHAGQGVSMALEDVFFLSKTLEDGSRPLEEAFERYERIRRPRTEAMAELAVKNAQIRKRSSVVGLRVKELLIWAYMSVTKVLGRPFGSSQQQQLLYDVEEEDV